MHAPFIAGLARQIEDGHRIKEELNASDTLMTERELATQFEGVSADESNKIRSGNIEQIAEPVAAIATIIKVDLAEQPVVGVGIKDSGVALMS